MTQVEDKALQPVSDRSVFTHVSFPAWPHSKPGPRKTPAPAGTKAVSHMRREQVMPLNGEFRRFDPETFFEDEADIVYRETQDVVVTTAQKQSHKTPERE